MHTHVQFLLLNIMFLRFLPVVGSINNSLMYILEKYYIVYVYHTFLLFLQLMTRVVSIFWLL